MLRRRLLIIGEVFVDHHLDIKQNGKGTSRLGGIFHAVRACAALGVEYAFAYFAPNYLEKDIKKFSEVLGANKIYQLGIIDKSPNLILIDNSDESGKQFYDNILCKQAEFLHNVSIKEVLGDLTPTDIIIFPGRYGNAKLLNELAEYKGRVHIDMNYDCEDILDLHDIKINTIFLSTSSNVYGDDFNTDNYQRLIDNFSEKKVDQLLIKENRGGSWLYDYEDEKSYAAPAYVCESIHSVGVGDAYDIAFICGVCSGNSEQNMRFASWVAAVYSKTLDYNIFQSEVKILLQNPDDFVEMDGIRVPWNSRKKYSIYMAAPDFDYINTQHLHELVEALLYHNFRPRLPIKENGQVTKDMEIHVEKSIYMKDIELLEECELMIATLLYNDQGTLVEIGNYHANMKPIILYDPYNLLDNIFLKHSCQYYCKTVSGVINTIFEIISGMVKDEK